MKVEAGVAEMREAIAKFIETAGAAAKGHCHFHAFAKKEALYARLQCELRISIAIILDCAPQIASQHRDGRVITNIQRRQLLREVAPVRGRESPLGEVVGKAFREVVVGAESLEGMMKNRSVAAVFEAGQ